VGESVEESMALREKLWVK